MASSSTAPASNSYVAPSVNTTKPCQILRIYAYRGNAAWTNPSGCTQRATGQDYANALLTDSTQAAAGATGTQPANGANLVAYDAYTVAIAQDNLAPNAPTLTGPANNATLDRGIAQRFTWTFSDPDTTDSQSKFDLQYRIVGAPSWTAVTGTTPNTFWDAAASTFAAGSYEWQVRTYDSQGVVGPWSSSSFFTAASAPPMPTITAPTSGGTVSNTATVTWSTPNQTDYQVRRLADNAGSADTGTVYYDSGDVVDATTRSVTLTFDTNNRLEHIQVRVKNNGLWSSWADIRVQVSYTPPQVPVVSAVAEPATASILVTITNPAPGTGQPTVSYNDVYLSAPNVPEFRCATNVPVNGSWIFYTPASGVTYTFRVVAVASNGTTASS